ncbi:hypothetical protein XNC1_3351 [Xenorhabdus nematophila ATCC 19061]|uniref:DUF2357 domain-containing protein n=1 Tax=Xenorhabdus nematophila (strain ATCC 19061 / DSM 3370 / CCUG 14189 / LMG 1036 / NCIMB 9965 / AN6) TaxID=406817 RepID=D3V949_XENNA|nr:nuclease domain-containing protein [Xenorhabdus nematophila]CBJ91399.1 hypothetical protein XNC1_3351 [Xenorhabdus nematophila ATCC 19061]
MKLELTILNGERMGERIELYRLDSNHYTMPYILENEAVEIKCLLDSEYEDVFLCLHENEIEYTTVHKDLNNDKWEYVWSPKKNFNQHYESFFYNYFGIAEFFVLLRNYNCEDVIFFQRINVLARKMNAERVDDMLSFLARHNNDALCAFFRVTRRNAGFKDGDTPADIFFEWVEKTTNNLYQLIDSALLEPITKLTTKYQYIVPTASTNVDDQTLSWICDNINDLYEIDQEQDAILEYNDKFYSTLKIRESALYSDSNIYENQVLHGFITTLKLAVSNLLAGFNTSENINENHSGYGEYISFYNQMRKFQKRINHKKIKKCREILILLNNINSKLNKVIPVKRQITGIPALTMKVKHNKAYLAIFKKIINWHRFGSPDWSTQEELLSIKSIPKLFEYYTLFYLKEILDRFFGYATLLESEDGKSFFSYRFNETRITLHYEPNYWMHGHKNSSDSSVVNIENWTAGKREIKKRSHVQINSKRSPDFVITAENDELNYHYIFDAKYTSPTNGFIRYLPELTMKYFHGLHDIKSKSKNILGLTIITPNSSTIIKHYHTDSFNIFSDTPSEPSLNVSSINPGQEFKENIIFEKMIFLILEKISLKVKLDELQEVIEELV